MEKNSPNKLSTYNDLQKKRAEYIEKGEKFIEELFEESLPKQKLDADTGNLINDLWLALSLYVGGYPFDEDHKVKHRILIKRAQQKLGIPETLEELVETPKENF